MLYYAFVRKRHFIRGKILIKPRITGGNTGEKEVQIFKKDFVLSRENYNYSEAAATKLNSDWLVGCRVLEFALLLIWGLKLYQLVLAPTKYSAMTARYFEFGQ